MIAQIEAPSRIGGGTQQVVLIRRERIRPFADQPRKYFDPQKLADLALSITAVGQILPILVIEVHDDPLYDYELVDGQRRWHACDIAGIAEMKAIIVTAADKTEQFTLSVIANFGREDHNELEAAYAVKYYRDLGWSQVRIAETFARSGFWVSQRLKLFELESDVLAMMSPDRPEAARINISTALLLADVPKDMQKKIADTIVDEGMQVKQARSFIRARAEKIGFTVGDPTRGPADDYSVFRALQGRIKRELELLTVMPQSFFDKMFAHRDSEDHGRMVERMEANAESMRLLLEAIKKAKKK